MSEKGQTGDSWNWGEESKMAMINKVKCGRIGTKEEEDERVCIGKKKRTNAIKKRANNTTEEGKQKKSEAQGGTKSQEIKLQ